VSALRVIVGIDPGVNGAIAVFVDGSPSIIRDMPTIQRHNGGNAVDALALHALFRDVCSAYRGAHIHAVIELPATRPHDAPTNILHIGEGFGILIGVMACHGITHTKVRPQEWKGWYGLVKVKQFKPTKEDSRIRACQLFPSRLLYLQRKCDHDRAEAMLMAKWAIDTECWIARPASAKKRVTKKRKPSLKIAPELPLCGT